MITATQAAEDELQALGLGTSATASQITAALKKHYPQGISTSQIDPATGLPYTQVTARAAGSGQLVGKLAGYATLSVAAPVLGVAGEVVEGVEAYSGLINASAADASGAPTAQDVEDAENPPSERPKSSSPTAKNADTAESDTEDQNALRTKAAVPAAQDAASELAAIWNWITTPSHWLRILEAIGGFIALYMGLRALIGDETPISLNMPKAVPVPV